MLDRGGSWDVGRALERNKLREAMTGGRDLNVINPNRRAVTFCFLPAEGIPSQLQVGPVPSNAGTVGIHSIPNPHGLQ